MESFTRGKLIYISEDNTSFVRFKDEIESNLKWIKSKKLKIIIEWKQFKFVGTIDNINKFTKNDCKTKYNWNTIIQGTCSLSIDINQIYICPDTLQKYLPLAIFCDQATLQVKRVGQ